MQHFDKLGIGTGNEGEYTTYMYMYMYMYIPISPSTSTLSALSSGCRGGGKGEERVGQTDNDTNV